MVKGVMGGPRGCKFRARARGALGGRRPVRGRWLLERKREGAGEHRHGKGIRGLWAEH